MYFICRVNYKPTINQNSAFITVFLGNITIACVHPPPHLRNFEERREGADIHRLEYKNTLIFFQGFTHF